MDSERSGLTPAAEVNAHSRWAHGIFLIGIFFKGLDGLLELAGGTLLLSTSRAQLLRLILSCSQDILREDPDNFFAFQLLRAGQHLSHGTRVLVALYFCINGGLKLFLVACLLMRKLWAYPLTASILALMIGFQCFELLRKPGLLLVAVTIVDIIILGSIGVEYRRMKRLFGVRTAAS